MGYAGSNYEPGTITPESGTLAGPGSYVALNSDGEMVLVTSTEGGGTPALVFSAAPWFLLLPV